MDQEERDRQRLARRGGRAHRHPLSRRSLSTRPRTRLPTRLGLTRPRPNPSLNRAGRDGWEARPRSRAAAEPGRIPPTPPRRNFPAESPPPWPTRTAPLPPDRATPHLAHHAAGAPRRRARHPARLQAYPPPAAVVAAGGRRGCTRCGLLDPLPQAHAVPRPARRRNRREHPVPALRHRESTPAWPSAATAASGWLPPVSRSTVERPGAPEGTMACPRCGTHNRAGVAFCQNCGANMRAVAPGYVPPAAPGSRGWRGEVRDRSEVGVKRSWDRSSCSSALVGIVTGYLLPFLYGIGIAFERAWGVPTATAWPSGPRIPEVGGLADPSSYYGLAAPIPILVTPGPWRSPSPGFVRAAPGLHPGDRARHRPAVERRPHRCSSRSSRWAATGAGYIVAMLRVLSPAGIIFMLSRRSSW